MIDNVGRITESDQKTNRYIVEASDEWDAIRQVQYKIHNFSNWCIKSVGKYRYKSPDDLVNACNESLKSCTDAYKELGNQTKTVFEAVRKLRERKGNGKHQ